MDTGSVLQLAHHLNRGELSSTESAQSTSHKISQLISEEDLTPILSERLIVRTAQKNSVKWLKDKETRCLAKKKKKKSGYTLGMGRKWKQESKA